MRKAECPQCGKLISVGTHPTMGKPIECEECGAELEVVWLDPLELDWRMEEDFDDLDDFGDEED
jgi:alpha-aminoadipate carrier protein LysW